MIGSLTVAGLLGAMSALPAHEGAAGGPTPGHPFFGAGFLFVGGLLVVETLAGRVWSRDRLRRMIWPVSLVLLGLGMLVVSYVQPTSKSLHLTLAILLILGGFFEGRYRLGQVPRTLADAFAVPTLIVGGFVIGPLHSNGSLLSSIHAQTHMLVGISGWALAGIRLAQMRLRHPPALESVFGVGVMALGLSLLIVQQFHGGH